MTTTSLKEHFAGKEGRNAKLLEPFNYFFYEIFCAREMSCVTKFIQI